MIRNNPANTDIWAQHPPGGRHIRLDDVMDMEMSFTLPWSNTCAVFMVIFVVMVNIIVIDNTLALHLPLMDDLASGPPEIFA